MKTLIFILSLLFINEPPALQFILIGDGASMDVMSCGNDDITYKSSAYQVRTDIRVEVGKEHVFVRNSLGQLMVFPITSRWSRTAPEKTTEYIISCDEPESGALFQVSISILPGKSLGDIGESGAVERVSISTCNGRQGTQLNLFNPKIIQQQ